MSPRRVYKKPTYEFDALVRIDPATAHYMRVRRMNTWAESEIQAATNLRWRASQEWGCPKSDIIVEDFVTIDPPPHPAEIASVEHVSTSSPEAEEPWWLYN